MITAVSGPPCAMTFSVRADRTLAPAAPTHSAVSTTTPSASFCWACEARVTASSVKVLMQPTSTGTRPLTVRHDQLGEPPTAHVVGQVHDLPAILLSTQHEEVARLSRDSITTYVFEYWTISPHSWNGAEYKRLAPPAASDICHTPVARL